MMHQFKLSSIYCAHNKVLILNQSENFVEIGIVDFENENLKNRIKKIYLEKVVNGKITFEKISDEEFKMRLPNMFQKEIVSKENNFDKKVVEEKNKIQEAANDEPVVNLLNAILIEAVKNDASDIHIEKCDVRFRINGLLCFQMTVPEEYAHSVVLRIKVLSGMDLSENRYAQDGRFSFDYEKINYDLRVSIVPVFEGESVVIRLLNRNYQTQSFEELGFSKEQTSKIVQLISGKQNLILICGPTGSGKSTTAATILSRLSNCGLKIISIEDPVEYSIKNITQIPVRPEIDLDFKDIIRKIFRQDPDVLMVGEIRDSITANVAVSFANTGHLVIATIHTSDCYNAILRLVDLGVSAFMIRSVLRGVISQNLILQNGKRRVLDAEILDVDKNFLSLLSDNPDVYRLREYSEEKELVIK